MLARLRGTGAFFAFFKRGNLDCMSDNLLDIVWCHCVDQGAILVKIAAARISQMWAFLGKLLIKISMS